MWARADSSLGFIKCHTHTHTQTCEELKRGPWVGLASSGSCDLDLEVLVGFWDGSPECGRTGPGGRGGAGFLARQLPASRAWCTVTCGRSCTPPAAVRLSFFTCNFFARVLDGDNRVITGVALLLAGCVPVMRSLPVRCSSAL